MPASTACTLFMLTSTTVIHIPNLTFEDAKAKFWEYNKHQEYPDVAMEAIYCGKKLAFILNHAYTDVIAGGKHEDEPGTQPTPEQQ